MKKNNNSEIELIIDNQLNEIIVTKLLQQYNFQYIMIKIELIIDNKSNVNIKTD